MKEKAFRAGNTYGNERFHTWKVTYEKEETRQETICDEKLSICGAN